MRNRKKIILVVLLFWIVMFIAANLVYTTHEIRSAFAAPNVQIQLYEPIIGIQDLDEESNRFEWKKITSSFAYARGSGIIWLFGESCEAYVVIDKTVISNTESVDKAALTREELVVFLCKICEGKLEKGEVEFRKDSKDAWDKHSEIQLFVTGKYEGYITLEKGHAFTTVDNTNLELVWSAADHFPYYAVVGCLVFATIISIFLVLIGVVIFRKTGKWRSLYLILTIPVVISVGYIIYLACTGYFRPF